ncbi:HlyD family efflux transporter periplasmic adaptor subunit [Octadecabacter sp. 1_MG-2023]|uniref:efflux RND transporter periplasmic adaptor subunit n=1 Tax=unclassified Octadecabacter TaxID=196158 RepID=UPI001C094A73|nr:MULTISPECIES: HlyD family efflux transporter periplasmic adaptor subunit [unclassified Octadecabacter]MBU2994165.1 HlyD family efflux transporter periplasmic adaptor subunit [Octadecabacter sp. B2R22]MDO6734546.1 HlyD family efflux transporter periplasmic adaptor subunit [Octadecabacter sp. 1_MG-2023]
MQFLRRSLIGIFLLSLTLALFAWAGNTVRLAVQERMNTEPRGFQQRERVLAVNVVQVTPETIAPSLVVFGELSSTNTFDLRALTGGTVLNVSENFIEGGRVERGELLVKIDPRDAQSARDRIAADLRDAEAEVRDAERALIIETDEVAAATEQATLRQQALQRQNDLVTRGVGTAAAVETAELAVSGANQAVLTRRQAEAQAQARLDQAATRLDRAQLNLADADRVVTDTEIHAPYSGVLADVTITQGVRVTANERLGEVIDNDQLEVSFRLSTAQYARLIGEDGALGNAPITVSLETQGFTLSATGQITRESAAVGEGQTGRLLFARLDTSTGLRPGDFVTVAITEPDLRGVALVPATAIDANETALLLGDENRLSEVDVEVLRRQGDDVIIRARDLYGKQIVAERSPLLGAGIAVQPIDPTAEPVVPEAPEMVAIDDEQRAEMIAFVEASRMPPPVKTRVLEQLAQDEVPSDVIARIQERMGS